MVAVRPPPAFADGLAWHHTTKIDPRTIDRRLTDFRYITDKEQLNSRRIAYESIRRGAKVRECEELIERLDKEIQCRQPILYPGHDDVGSPAIAQQLNLDIPRPKKILNEALVSCVAR